MSYYNTEAKAGVQAQEKDAADRKANPAANPGNYANWLKDEAARKAGRAYGVANYPYTRGTEKPSDRQKEYFVPPNWSYTPTGTSSPVNLAGTDHCDATGSKDAKLRDILMVQLQAMANSAGTSDEGCSFACGEDAELDKMQTLYAKFNTDMGNAGGMCSIGDFTNNPRIVVLKAQKSVLEFMTFSFLHQTCEGTHDCNPYDSMMPPALLNCCGLYEGAPLFYDGDLQAVGSYLAGAQGSPKGLTPAANGHCANFYMSGTIAPGRDKQLYVNVCYVGNSGERGVLEKPSSSTSSSTGTGKQHIGMKWVKANRMERAKFDALQEIEAKMVAQKRSVLQVNHKMLQLQQSLVGLNPYASSGGGGGSAANNDEFLTKKLRAVVESSTRRVRNEMGRRFGQMEDEHRLALPQLMSPSGRAGSELRAIDRLRRGSSRSRGNSRSRSRRAAAAADAAARAARAASDDDDVSDDDGDGA